MKILVRVLLLIVVIVVAFIVYVAVAGTQVIVTSQGCGTLQPPVALPIAWQTTGTGGIAKMPPFTVDVVTAAPNGQDTITATGPAGINASFPIANNVTLVRFDGTTLYRRLPLLRHSMTADLGKAPQHHLLLVCH